MGLQLHLLMQTMAALGIGLLIGLEREYGQRRVDGKIRHVEAAGIRTFAFVALTGNLLTWLPETIMPWGIALGLAFTGGMAAISYRRTSRGKGADIGITSEVVLVLTFVLGVLTGIGFALQAAIMAILVFLLLNYKKVLHRFSYSLSRMDMRQALQFLVITVVVLPVLPNQAYGPYDAFNPHHLWLMVVLISSIGFTAYASIKILGQRAGLGLTGVLGGFASTTAVTPTMSRLCRSNPDLQTSCLLSILLACATMFPRVVGLTLLFSPAISLHLLLPVGVILVYTLITTVLLWRKSRTPSQAESYHPEMNPLSLRMALGFGVFYAFIVFFTHAAQAHFGEGGILTVAGLSGLSDVDAITLSVSGMTPESLSATLAAQAILLACAANSLVKMGMGFIFAAPAARMWLAVGLLPMSLISLAGALML